MQDSDRQSWSHSNKGRPSASGRGNEAANHVPRGHPAPNHVSGDGLWITSSVALLVLGLALWRRLRVGPPPPVFRLEPAHRPRPPRMAHSLGGAKSPSSPRDPLHHLLIALLFCSTPFVSKPILFPPLPSYCCRRSPHTQTPSYRSCSNTIIVVPPTSWHRPCSTVLKPSSNSSSRPNRVSGATMHICPKNSVRSSGYRPPSSLAMYTRHHALPWLTKPHGRCPRRQIWCISLYGRLFGLHSPLSL
jgi:hypothetical protein